MEARLSDRLRSISNIRTKITEKFFSFIPVQHHLENAILFHVILIFSTATIITAIFVQTKGITLFSLHPVCMTIGILIFVGEGIVAYRNRVLLETLGPIMQHNKKTKARTIHYTNNIIGTVFILFGILCVLANKLEYNKSIIPKTFHSILGVFTLSLIIWQISTGYQKLSQFDRSNTKIKRWHGDQGLLIWDLACLAIVVGLFEFLNYSVTNILVECSVSLAWLAVHAQMKRKISDSTSMDFSGDLESESTVANPVIPAVSSSLLDGFEAED